MLQSRRVSLRSRHWRLRGGAASVATVIALLTTVHAPAWSTPPGTVAPTGVLTTISEAQLNAPGGVAVDGSGNVVIADTANHRIRRLDVATGVVTSIAGTGTADASSAGFGGDGGPATAASLNAPAGVAVDGAGNVLIADTANHRIRRLDAATGVLSTVAGNGKPGSAGDGGPAAAAQLNAPAGVAVDGAGNVVIADTANHRIRRLDAATGVLSTVAGTGTSGSAGKAGTGDSAGDGGPATAASLNAPAGVAVDGAGNVVIADTANHRIGRLHAATGVLTTLFGGEELAPPTAPADGAAIAGPSGVAVDGAGAVLVANRARNRVDRIADPTPAVTTTPAEPVAPAAPGGSVCDRLEGSGGAAGTVSLDSPTAVPGEELALEGTGFVAGEQLTVTLCSAPRNLGSITADPLGRYQASVRIPADVPLGAHHLVVSDRRGNAAVGLTLAQRDGGRGGGGTDDTPSGEDDPLGFDDPNEGLTDEELLAQLKADLEDEVAQAEADDLLEESDDLDDFGDIPTTGAEVAMLVKLALLSLGSGFVLMRGTRSHQS